MSALSLLFISDSSMHLSPLFSEERIRARVSEMAREISDFYAARDGGNAAPAPVLAVVLANGALFFAADLLRRLSVPAEIEVVRVASYGAGTRSNGAPEILGAFPREKMRGRRVMIVDDVLDTGHTLAKLREETKKCGAADVRLCVLLDKPARRLVPERADFVGFPIDDVFVVGYGLDLDGAWRTLPYVAAVSSADNG